MLLAQLNCNESHTQWDAIRNIKSTLDEAATCDGSCERECVTFNWRWMSNRIKCYGPDLIYCFGRWMNHCGWVFFTENLWIVRSDWYALNASVWILTKRSLALNRLPLPTNWSFPIRKFEIAQNTPWKSRIRISPKNHFPLDTCRHAQSLWSA